MHHIYKKYNNETKMTKVSKKHIAMTAPLYPNPKKGKNLSNPI